MFRPVVTLGTKTKPSRSAPRKPAATPRASSSSAQNFRARLFIGFASTKRRNSSWALCTGIGTAPKEPWFRWATDGSRDQEALTSCQSGPHNGLSSVDASLQFPGRLRVAWSCLNIWVLLEPGTWLFEGSLFASGPLWGRLSEQGVLFSRSAFSTVYHGADKSHSGGEKDSYTLGESLDQFQARRPVRRMLDRESVTRPSRLTGGNSPRTSPFSESEHPLHSPTYQSQGKCRRNTGSAKPYTGTFYALNRENH